MKKLLKKLHLREQDVFLMTIDEKRTVSYVLKNSPDGQIREVDL